MNRHEDPQVNDEAIFDAWWYNNLDEIRIQHNHLATEKDIARVAFMAGVAYIEEGWIE